jgi:hypothetical protein
MYGANRRRNLVRYQLPTNCSPFHTPTKPEGHTAVTTASSSTSAAGPLADASGALDLCRGQSGAGHRVVRVTLTSRVVDACPGSGAGGS